MTLTYVFGEFFKAETFRSFYRGMLDSIIAHFLLKRRAELDDLNPLEQYAAFRSADGCFVYCVW